MKVVLFSVLLALSGLSDSAHAQNWWPFGPPDLDTAPREPVVPEEPDPRLYGLQRTGSVVNTWLPAWRGTRRVRHLYRVQVDFDEDDIKPQSMVFIVNKSQWERLYVGQRVIVPYDVRGYALGLLEQPEPDDRAEHAGRSNAEE